MKPYEHHRNVTITKHALKRLRERVKTHEGFDSWEALAKKARYAGRAEASLTDDEYEWCLDTFKWIPRSAQIREYNGFAYLFEGAGCHARKLITVIPMFDRKERRS